jgi:hypothetical protein
MVQSAGEMGSTYPAQVASTHCAAEVTTTHPVKMSTVEPTAERAFTAAGTTCKRIGRNASASDGYGGTKDREFVQHKSLHGSFLSR